MAAFQELVLAGEAIQRSTRRHAGNHPEQEDHRENPNRLDDAHRDDDEGQAFSLTLTHARIPAAPTRACIQAENISAKPVARPIPVSSPASAIVTSALANTPRMFTMTIMA